MHVAFHNYQLVTCTIDRWRFALVVVHRPHTSEVTVKSQEEACLYSTYYELLISRCSGMARVNKGSYSFTCHPHIYPQVEWTIPAFNSQPQSIGTLAGTHFPSRWG